MSGKYNRSKRSGSKRPNMKADIGSQHIYNRKCAEYEINKKERVKLCN
ncbi:hypothetical protein NVP1115B_58 [Vibrio phage 1.115.B._10N.222.49.B11]|nr:hypothetical protein NVP1115A_58 [Vibrio phage 1.115.A._10N.222.49.B11]AUR88604.1 hypothetical protein NVP1115B_58 [Vibrio phage 1.115.B._10N.222.49.B11]AUR89790.1 hypothetical protein NVP1132O_54 [Vibrio phage 1.132.O._10N.222.49.F8]AUR89919.1 hypothetical protein NVP1134O_52 [Vibrio phage 1.134.O._10N.222.52.B8]AUR96584.1 hypothetical protein NVP1226O_57 [Vibrio phage 1.226.O._10N.261.48.E5]